MLARRVRCRFDLDLEHGRLLRDGHGADRDDVVCLRPGGALGEDRERSRQHPVPMRGRVGRIMEQHDLKPLRSLLNGNMVAAIHSGHQSDRHRSEWCGGDEVKQEQAASTQQTRRLPAARNGRSAALHL